MEEIRNDQVLFSFPRGEGESVHFTAMTYKNRDYFDVRIWFYDAEQKMMRPTRKGICFEREQILRFKEGIEALKKALDK